MVIETDAPPTNPVGDFEDFLKNFEESPNEFKYRQKISEAYARSENFITVLFEDILNYDPPLANYLKTHPEQALEEAVEGFKNIIRIDAGGYFNPSEDYFMQISTHNNSNEVPLRKIRAKHIDRLIFLKGIIIRASIVRPKVTNATFECPICGNIMQEEQLTSKLTPPRECTNPACKNTKEFKVDTRQSDFINHQSITLQEAPEDLRSGDIPQTLQAILQHHLVDTARPGERVKIMGVLKSIPKEDRRGRLTTVFVTQLMVNSLQGIKQDDEVQDLTQEDIDEINALSVEPMIQQKIARSIARGILGHDQLKMGAALSLFAGNQKLKKDGSKLRGDIHVLFIGDPGTGKSQILQNCAQIAQRSVYTSGKGSSAAGLCVAGDTDIIFENKIVKIKDIVEDQFEVHKAQEYNEKMIFVENGSDSQRIMNSADLKVIPNKVSRFWKIKSPENIIAITTKTGKKLKLTPQTPLKIIDRDEGVIWKPVSELQIGNRVAIARKLQNTKEISVPSVYEILKTYSGKITILNIGTIVEEIIGGILKNGLTIGTIAERLNVSEGTINSWVSDTARGNISFSNLGELCRMSKNLITDILPNQISVQIKKGQSILIPKQLTEEWFYILGLLMGDGRVSQSKHEGSYGGISIGLSSREPKFLSRFQKFFSTLNLSCSITEGNAQRPTEYKIHSKLIFHVFNHFGLGVSPKSTSLKPNKSILFYPKQYAFAMLKGLYDADGWISISDNHSHEIGFVSTSINLVEFIRYTLSKLGIISFMRMRPPTTSTLKNGTQIIGKNPKFILNFSQFGDFIKFKREIGFFHPDKKEKLEISCKNIRQKHTNYDNIPNVRETFNKIIGFYNQSSSSFSGQKATFSPSKKRMAISTEKLKEYLEKINPNWKNHRIHLTIEMKNILYSELSKKSSNDDLCKQLKITRAELYDLFLRKNRAASISAGKISIILDIYQSHLTEKTLTFYTNLISNIHKQDEQCKQTLQMLKSLCQSDVYWDEITKIEIINATEEYVYDLTVPHTHNFLANMFVTHNTAAVVKESDNTGMQLEAGALVLASGGIAAIDEFDKMRKQDRSAIHEAMEQQSYHPDFEITFNDKRSVQIGQFVDKLFDTFPEKKIEGVNCEILPISDKKYTILTSDFVKEYPIVINRVSRHQAPAYFIKITYSNGRKIRVTPEHPIFVFGEEAIITQSAEKINQNMFVPAINQISYKGQFQLQTNIKTGRKKVKLPSKITMPFAKFLGYFVTEAYSYDGSSAEVGLSNTDPIIVNKMIESIEKSFDVTPIDNGSNNRSIRIISRRIFDYLQVNFPEIMKKSINKRIPRPIFLSSTDIQIEFLNAAFEGDGGVESTSMAYSTASQELAYDYQDLLLVHGIHTRITKNLYHFGPENELERYRYKVYISGDSLADFVKKIIPDMASNQKVSDMILKSNRKNRKHDIVPPYVGTLLRKCLKLVGETYDGYFNQHIENNYGINKSIIDQYLNRLKTRAQYIEENINSATKITDVRSVLQYSQQQLADLLGVTRGRIDYLERGGYDKTARIETINTSKEKTQDVLQKFDQIISNIHNIMHFRWLRIKKVEKVENIGENKVNWVYDVTVEPTENFVSHGILLHNTISIAKAGIVATLQAKTAIIAAANPKQGRWNEFETAAANINLSPPILSRFDLIFVVRDVPDKNADDRIAEYILNNHMQGFDETYVEEDDKKKLPTEDDFIPIELLKKYIQYCKNNCHPKLTRESARKIQDYYVKMRMSNPDNPAAVSIVARTLDGMVRMSEAYAKMALRDTVLLEDTEAMIALLDRSLHEIGYDKETGKVDMDVMLTGTSSNKRNKLNLILNKIRELQLEDPSESLTWEDIYETLSTVDGISEQFVKGALAEWYKDGTLYSPTNDHYKLSSRPKKPKN